MADSQHSTPELLKRVSAAIYDDGYDSTIGPKAALHELVEQFEEEVDNAANEYALLLKRFQRLEEQLEAAQQGIRDRDESDDYRVLRLERALRRLAEFSVDESVGMGHHDFYATVRQIARGALDSIPAGEPRVPPESASADSSPARES